MANNSDQRGAGEDRSSTGSQEQSGCNALMYACQQGDIQQVQILLKQKPALAREKDRTLKTALHYCAETRTAQCADLVYRVAPDFVNAPDEDGLTPLHLAVIAGNIPLTNFLLANNANVKALDNEKHTVVHWATVCGETAALRAVLLAGAPISTPDVHGGFPLHYAAQMCGTKDALNPNERINSASKDLSKLGLEVLDTLLSFSGIKVDVEDGDGRQPLLWAASAGSAPAVLALVAAGSAPEAADRDGLTALHCAASRGHTDCIEALLMMCGVAPDIIDTNGCTALHYAVTLGHADATALLLAHGAKVNRQDRKGRTPAHCGCAKGQVETVRMLGAHGADLWIKSARGDLPLHEAAGSGRRQLVRWLLAQRPSQVNATNNDGRTPLHVAALNDNTDLCKIFLDHGANVNAVLRTSKNVLMTPLDCALKNGFRSTAKYLQLNGGLPFSRLRHPLDSGLGGGFNVQLHNEIVIHRVDPNLVQSDSDSDFKNNIKPQKRRVFKHRRKVKISEGDNTKHVDAKKFSKHEVQTSSSVSSIVETPSRSKNVQTISKESQTEERFIILPIISATEVKLPEFVNERENNELKVSIVDLRSLTDSYISDHSAERVKITEVLVHANQDDHEEEKVISSNAKITEITDSVLDDLKDSENQSKENKEIEIENQEAQKDNIEPAFTVVETTENHTVESKDLEEVRTEVTEAEVVGDNKSEIIQETVQESDNQTQIEKNINQDEKKMLEFEEKEEEKEDNHIENEKENISETKVDLASQDILDEVANDKNEINQEKETPIENGSDLRSNEKSETKDVLLEHKDNENISEKNLNEEEDKTIKPLETSSNKESPKSQLSDKNYKSFQILSETFSSEEKPENEILSNENKTQEKNEEQLSDKKSKADNEEKPINKPRTRNEVRKKETVIRRKPTNGRSLDEKVKKAEQESSSINLEKRSQVSETSATEIKENKQLDQNEEDIFKNIDMRKDYSGSQSEDEIIATSQKLSEAGDQDSGSKEEYSHRSTESEQAVDKIKREIPVGKNRSAVIIKDDYSDDSLADRDPESFKRSRVKRKKSKLRSKSAGKESYGSDSQMLDSGFEPSPRSSRIPRRTCSTKPDVNMTTVTQTVQSNIRRYHLERKIFQQLLELKRLQIRNGQTNEPVLVKRAIDEYHRSVLTTVGAGRYTSNDLTFKSFEKFLYESLRKLQKGNVPYLERLPEAPPLYCTHSTLKCDHATHAYTGIPCAAYISKINHHTIPKIGFGTRPGSFLPKLKPERHVLSKGAVTLELTHGRDRQLVTLPAERLDQNKKYYVTFTVKGHTDQDQELDNRGAHRHAKSC